MDEFRLEFTGELEKLEWYYEFKKLNYKNGTVYKLDTAPGCSIIIGTDRVVHHNCSATNNTIPGVIWEMIIEEDVNRVLIK